MKIIINNLWGDNGFQYSKEVEKYLGEKISNMYNMVYDDLTEGYNPYYDFKLNDSFIETKITSKVKPHIEFARYDKRPSGLLLTRSDYHLIISPGGSKGEFVGKVRLYKTNELKKHLIEILLAQGEQKLEIYKPSNNSPGAVCFELEPKTIDDIWLGDCNLIFDGSKVSGFDMSSFRPSKRNLIL